MPRVPPAPEGPRCLLANSEAGGTDVTRAAAGSCLQANVAWLNICFYKARSSACKSTAWGLRSMFVGARATARVVAWREKLVARKKRAARREGATRSVTSLDVSDSVAVSVSDALVSSSPSIPCALFLSLVWRLEKVTATSSTGMGGCDK